MEMVTLNVKLSVEIWKSRVIAHLAFSNNMQYDINLDRFTICLDGRFRNRVFVIRTGRGKEVNYKGPMVKRKLRPEDSLKLSTGETIRTSIVLNSAYELEDGKKYIIQYVANNPGTVINSVPVLMEMISNKVEIIYN